MTYNRVKRSHVVPKFILERFAKDGQIALEAKGEKKVVSTSSVATRKNFYSRTRPDQSRIDDVEDSLSRLENQTAPILRTVEQSWPPSNEDKAILAEHFGHQVVRIPKWKAWFNEFVARKLDAHARDPYFALDSGVLVPISLRDREELAEHLLSDSHRLHRMLRLGHRMASIIGSMHWRLLMFDEPIVGISDHPVVQIPMNVLDNRNGDPFSHGAVNSFEVYVPISPESVILMTWINQPDPSGYWRASVEQAGMINSLVKGQAEHQWMHHPDYPPAESAVKWVPITSQICPWYNPELAMSSPRRAMVVDILNSPGSKDANHLELVFANWGEQVAA